MSAATVRAALFDYFNSASIPGLHKMYRAAPWWIDGGNWSFETDGGSGSVAFLQLAEKKESRITVPAVIGGQKSVSYTVVLYVLYQWLQNSAATEPVPEDAWVGPLDTTLDALDALIRADANGGNPQVIFEIGQDPNDLMIQRDLPFTVAGSGAICSWNALHVHVTEIITA